MKSIEQVISKRNRKKIINFHDFSICLAQGWFSKLKKSVSSVSAVRVYHCMATISHGSDIPTNDVVWEIVPLLRQRRLKLWKVCRLIRASTHTSVQLAPDVLNWRKIWRHRRPFHHIQLFAVKNCVVARAVWGRALSCCSIVTPLPAYRAAKPLGQECRLCTLGIKGTFYSHKLSFSIVRNSTPHQHRTAPRTISP